MKPNSDPEEGLSEMFWQTMLEPFRRDPRVSNESTGLSVTQASNRSVEPETQDVPEQPRRRYNRHGI